MVEFAIVAPMLILLLLGVGDLAPTILAKTRVANATHSAADLTSQFPQMQTSDMVGVFAGAADVLAPLSKAGLVLRITNVASDGKGRASVYWSCGQGTLPANAAGSTVTTTPTGSTIDNVLFRSKSGNSAHAADTSVVFVESSYVYTAPAGFVIKTAQTLTAAVTAVPRLSGYIGFPWNGDTDITLGPPSSSTRRASVTLSNGAVCNYSY